MGYDHIEIEFLPRGDSQNVPAYKLKRENSFLSLTFSDTTDFDINAGVSTFVGNKQQTVEGFVAREIVLNYPADDSLIGISIDCKGTDFGYRITEEDLKLIIDLQ